MISTFPNTCLADNDNPVKEQTISCSPPSITVNLVVTVGPHDCLAMQYCRFEIVVYYTDNCTENGPIAIQDYYYPDPVIFPPLVVGDGGNLMTCIRLKPGTNCTGYDYYIPPCCCSLVKPDMSCNFNICTP